MGQISHANNFRAGSPTPALKDLAFSLLGTQGQLSHLSQTMMCWREEDNFLPPMPQQGRNWFLMLPFPGWPTHPCIHWVGSIVLSWWSAGLFLLIVAASMGLWHLWSQGLLSLLPQALMVNWKGIMILQDRWEIEACVPHLHLGCWLAYTSTLPLIVLALLYCHDMMQGMFFQVCSAGKVRDSSPILMTTGPALLPATGMGGQKWGHHSFAHVATRQIRNGENSPILTTLMLSHPHLCWLGWLYWAALVKYKTCSREFCIL